MLNRFFEGIATEVFPGIKSHAIIARGNTNVPAIRAIDLGRRYDGFRGLESATFTVDEGKLGVIVGPNGAGKTTCIKILTTFLRPSKGRAEVFGMDIVNSHEWVRKRIVHLPQEYDLSRDLTPLEAVKWNLVTRGWSISEAKAQAKTWLETLRMWEMRNRACLKLSGGQKRRVAVAMTLAPEADLVFLDEPTVGLDIEIKHEVWRAIREAVSDGGTILLTTHDMAEAETISDKVIIMNKGRTIIEEEPEKLVNSLRSKYRVVVDNSAVNSNYNEGADMSIDIGDRRILYFKTHEEALTLIDNFSASTRVHSLSKVGLEDVYLQFVGELNEG